MLKATAPSSSTRNVILAIWKTSLRVLRGEPAFSVSSLTVIRRLNPTLCPTSRAARVVTVMIPSPPNCISTIITSSPKWVKVSGIATVERPVTVLQLTATKNALTREIPSVVAHDSLSNAVPPATSARNP